MLSTYAQHALPPALRRLLWGIACVGLLAGGVVIAGAGTWQLWVAFVLPDVALLLGTGRGLANGQLHPRAVPLYNALHRPLAPAALAVASIWLGPAWLAGAMGWAAHIAMDRAAGYRLRTRDGFQRVG